MWPAACAMIQTSLQIDETEFIEASAALCVTALIAGASAGRWATEVLLVSSPLHQHHTSLTAPYPIPPPSHCPCKCLADVQNEFRRRSSSLRSLALPRRRWGRLNWEVCLPVESSVDSVPTNQKVPVCKWPPQSYIRAPVHYLTTSLFCSWAPSQQSTPS